VRRGDRVDHFDTVRQRKDGSLVDISLTVSPVRDRTGRIIGASKIARDVSDRKRFEAMLRQSMSMKDEFLSMVSHELRTPIATILGNGQLLLNRGDRLQEDDKRQALADIVGETERLQRIIENLLMLSRMEAGRTLTTEPLRLPRLAEEAVADLQRRACSHSIELKVEEPVPIALGEQTLVMHVLENLLSNAAKYSAPDAPIEVIVSTTENGWPRVEVLDRGIGFAGLEAEQLFTPFYRARAATQMASGMGLGLAVCKRSVEAQGGTIIAAARPGGGASFSVTLPPA
jgi:signal transduction histidine kinase